VNKLSVVILTISAYSVAGYAQTSVTLYGTLDEFITYQRSSSGKSLTALGDGALYRSRFGMQGTEDLGSGYQVRFDLESGISAPTGASADSSRLFDRQAWVGLNTPVGEFRFGRQNTAIFYAGPVIDYTGRATMGSIVNNFGGVLARFDNDISYKSPRVYHFQIEAHYAMPGIAGDGLASGAVYQLRVDYSRNAITFGYVGLVANPLPSGIYQNKIQYHNLYADYNYGPGKIYLAYVHSNNITGNSSGNDAAGILSPVSIPNNFFPGTNVDVRRFYDIYQVSMDYRVQPDFTVGGLAGVMRDGSDAGNNVYGGSLGGVYSLSKTTSVYGYAVYMKNQGDAGFRFSGSGAPPNLSGSDINGRGLIGLQLGMYHLF